jgi:hypothetical protein
MRRNLLFLITILFFISFSSCGQNKVDSQGRVRASEDPQTLALKMKHGMKIILAHRDWNPGAESWGNAAFRVITIMEPSGAEGLSLQWINPPPGLLAHESESQPSQAKKAQVYDLAGTQSGELSLPNLTHARRMTLPLFWPNGELFLSNSTGIWLSDIAFEELKKNRKTQWNSGLLNNPLLGPVQGVAAIEEGLTQLENALESNEEKKESSLWIKAKKPEEYKIIVDGKEQVVEVLPAGNWLASYKILHNTQNPIILEVTLAPDATLGQILFSPLGLLKGLAEYKVVEIQSPEYQAKKAKNSPVTEM